MTENIISLKNITKIYENQTAIKNISFDISKGKIFGLLGPNGAGKTTILRIINQIISPTYGEVLFNGTTLNESHLKYIGYMPEERGVYKNMGVEEQAVYFGTLRGLNKKYAKELANYWFEKLEMSSWKNKRANQLSKGMGQKLQFVITVLHNPKLLILDEPFSGFDPMNEMIVRNEIINLKNNGCSIILSTHRMESVDELCDNIAIIHKSQKILDGNVDKIKKKYSEGYFRIGIKTNKLNELKDNYTLSNLNILGNNKIEFSIKSHDINKEIKEIMHLGELYSFKEDLPKINDIFIELVKK